MPRRRKRETVYRETSNSGTSTRAQFPKDFIAGLSPSLRVISRLINCALNKQEIAYLLNITDTALRQRFTALRREWKHHIDSGGEGPEYIRETNTPFQKGLLRRSLVHSFVVPEGRAIGTHDPDGHLLIVRTSSAHKKSRGGNNKDEGDNKVPSSPDG